LALSAKLDSIDCILYTNLSDYLTFHCPLSSPTGLLWHTTIYYYPQY